MLEVLISRPLPLEKTDAAWQTLAKNCEIKVRPKTARGLLAQSPHLKNASAVVSLLNDTIDARFFDRAPKLKVVANFAVGYNNIDVKAAVDRGIVVCNTPDVLTNATAELTIGLIFAAARRFKEGAELMRKNAFKGWEPDLLLGKEIAGSTLGLIGHGRIGKAVAKKAEALGMKVLAVSRKGPPAFDDVIASADFISLHCPLTDDTRNLISSRAFARMKPGAFLINTARGEVVDEKALVAALGPRGKLAGAALDVFRGEPKLALPLRHHPKIFVLPHLGSATLNARRAMARLVLLGIHEVLSGRKPSNQVS